MPETLEYDEENTGVSGTCPFCKGIFRVNAGNTQLSHTAPECPQFVKMAPKEYLDYVRKHPVQS